MSRPNEKIVEFFNFFKQKIAWLRDGNDKNNQKMVMNDGILLLIATCQTFWRDYLSMR